MVSSRSLPQMAASGAGRAWKCLGRGVTRTSAMSAWESDISSVTRGA